jgi:hypothetical protein
LRIPWKRPFQKHCSDELALAYLDGELSLPAEKAVRKHLNTCWECRGRLAELEEQAQAVARALAESTFPGAHRKLEAEQRFSAWEQRFERSRGVAPRLFLLPAASFRWWPAISAAAILVIFTVLWQLPGFQRRRAVAALMAGQQVESEFQRSAIPIHQSLRVEISEIRPARRRSGGRIEIWSEPARGRFSSRWRDDDGSLQFALWRPEKNREYVFNARTPPGVTMSAKANRETGSLAQLSAEGVDRDRIAAAFMRWLQSRRWRPISLTNDIFVLLDDTGVTLRSEHVRAADGKPAMRLSAQRVQAGQRLEIVLELDAESYRPRLERVRFEAGGRAVELCLTMEREESVPSQRIVPAVFLPDVAPALPVAPTVARAEAVSPAIVPIPTLAPPPVDPAAERAAFEAANIEVRYVLHRAGACLGEPIEISEDPAGFLHVSGLSPTAERKAELVNLLAQLEAGSRVKVDIRTVEEATIWTPPPAEPLRQETQSSASPLPMQTQLERYFANREPSAGARRQRIAELTNAAVSTADAALAHAWALRRLAACYEHSPAAALRPQSRWLLEVMLRDHLTALRAASGSIRELLDPLLTLANGPLPGPPTPEGPGSAGWTTATLTVFNTVERIDRLVQAQFAGASLESQRVELAAAELQGVLCRLDPNIRALDVQVAREFRLEAASARRPE